MGRGLVTPGYRQKESIPADPPCFRSFIGEGSVAEWRGGGYTPDSSN